MSVQRMFPRCFMPHGRLPNMRLTQASKWTNQVLRTSSRRSKDVHVLVSTRFALLMRY